MGFNKRYVRKETIILKFKESGIDGLGQIFTPKVDAYIFEDAFSSMIFKLFDNGEFRKIKCLIR